MHQPPLRGRPILAGREVLLIDPDQLTRYVRASVLMSQGIEVHVAESLSAARCLFGDPSSTTGCRLLGPKSRESKTQQWGETVQRFLAAAPGAPP